MLGEKQAPPRMVRSCQILLGTLAVDHALPGSDAMTVGTTRPRQLVARRAAAIGHPEESIISSDLKVLLVEDSYIDATLFAETLRRRSDFSSEIVIVRRLDEAMQAVESKDVGLVVLDLNLPDSAGMDTFDSLYAVTDAPIIILTGANDSEAASLALSRGAEDYVVKGQVDSHTLIRAMRFGYERWLRQRAQKNLDDQALELELIHELQKGLLPVEGTRQQAGFELAAAVFPAERASGDFGDIVLTGDRCSLLVADVSGHGLKASQLMLTTRATLRALATQLDDTGRVFDIADHLLYHDLETSGLFVTAMAVELDCHTGRGQYTAAGHVGYLVRASGELETLEAQTVPLGITEIDWGPEHSGYFQMNPGDLLFIPTDGLVEAFNSDEEQFGLERVREFLVDSSNLSPEEVINGLFEQVRFFGAGVHLDDDVTMLVARFVG
jgi:serine phosphatase RsbU (regulator of sigma subunit)